MECLLPEGQGFRTGKPDLRLQRFLPGRKTHRYTPGAGCPAGTEAVEKMDAYVDLFSFLRRCVKGGFSVHRKEKFFVRRFSFLTSACGTLQAERP